MFRHKHTDTCCHDPFCCPTGLTQHIRYYRYLRELTDITFKEYWWHELKSLLGFNKADE